MSRQDIENHSQWEVHEFIRKQMIQARDRENWDAEDVCRSVLTRIAEKIACDLNLPGQRPSLSREGCDRNTN